MSSSIYPSRPAASQGRVIERRRRSRVRPGPDELFVLYLVLSPFVALGGSAIRGAGKLLRRLRNASLPQLDRLADAADGATVRVRGAIEPLGPGFETPGQKEVAVFARSIYVVPPVYRRETATYADETRGIDFVIRLPSGEALNVSARDVRLEDSPRRSRSLNLTELVRRGGQADRSPILRRRPLVREAILRAGDRVETSGVLVREVAPRGEAPLGRGTPLVSRLVPAAGTSYLWVRRLDERHGRFRRLLAPQ
jgi:hypothetical protein